MAQVSFIKKAAAVLLSMVIALALSECLLRLSGITDSYSEMSGAAPYMSEYDTQGEGWFHSYPPRTTLTRKGTESTYYLNTNSEGFNDREWNLRKADTTQMRALFIGDSFTDNVGGNGFSFEKQLEKSIDSLEIMNAGVSGSDPFFEYQLLSQKLLKYKPDRVFVFLNLSDITDVIVRGGFERFTTDGKVHYKPGPWWEPIFAKVHIVRAFAKAFLSRQFLLPNQEKIAKAEAINKIEKCLDAFQTTCDENSMRCTFVFIPVKSEVVKDIMDADPLLKYCRSANYQTIDLLDYFVKSGVTPDNASQYYGVLDGHENNEGYALIGRGLQQYFEESVHRKLRN